MKKALILILSFILLPNLNILANRDILKKTYVYSVKGTDTLRLDKYDLPLVSETKPCIIFMFGGGFSSGKRDDKTYVEYFERLINKGYVVVSIDYRLGMKNLKSSIDSSGVDPIRFAVLLKNSISIAVEDLFDATSYVVDHAKEWNIDSNLIIANGSSAGAVSVLHGEYAICNQDKVAEKLPKGFNYAGIIAFAGAIFSTDGDLTWKTLPAPIQMFHGDADRNVPYDNIELYQYGFYGSKHISEQLKAHNTPYYFYDVKNAAHEMSGDPMTDNIDEISSFLSKFVIKKLPLMIHSEIQQIGKADIKKDFDMMDYIKMNFE
ncbi:carboxylesterase family protein [Dysgonomonas sp. Marseille-P4677]|uniref:alpha/beta hydrolase n=1 Tax=Dysgonomonas sp. Marseille-P4677 TaxID=2364790 RepID=UPI001912440D|nr:carboxylesterase family protein [Dysgonomonas sp. Marseille-P4677]MBK5721518.1 carboxylesterase family protein [Dysgonomonas sp. Marseille-P4677]